MELEVKKSTFVIDFNFFFLCQNLEEDKTILQSKTKKKQKEKIKSIKERPQINTLAVKCCT